MTEEVAMGRMKEHQLEQTEALGRELKEIFDDVGDSDVWERLQVHAETDDHVAHDWTMRLLNSAGTVLYVAVAAASTMEADPEDVVQALMPDIMQAAFLTGVVAGREHQRRGYSL